MNVKTNNNPKNNFLIFGSPQINDIEIDEVIDSLKSGWLGTGPKVEKFNNNFKKYKNIRHAVAVNSCTAALHLSLIALDLKQGDEVITTPMTFCSTVNTIIHAGATPILADVDPDSMNIDPEKIEEKITQKTKCILPVHFAGRPCNMNKIMNIADKHNLFVIEDCAHAIETRYNGKHAGTFGDFGCFSFYVTKNLVTGEGGMVISNHEEKANRIKSLALHGLSKDAWKRFSDEGYQHYFVEEAGFKYNMMDIQAAIGIHQLKRIETNWSRRQEIWNYYNDKFSELPIVLPEPPETQTRHAYHLYTILIDEKKSGLSRDSFLIKMNSEGIGVGVHYLSIPEHPYYKKHFGWKAKDYPNAMKIGRETVSLPLSPKLSDYDVDRVVNTVKKILN
jgi:dTDP-4-amino-4,6-dideoxygalactose transaminase